MKQLALVVLLSVCITSVFGQDSVNEMEYISDTDNTPTDLTKRLSYFPLPLPVIYLGNCEITSSTLGIGGKSSTIDTDIGTYYVCSSIGQSGVIGTFTESGYSFRQGFQQPVNSFVVFKESLENPFRINVYPNPFKRSVSISFDEISEEEVYIAVYDASGRIVLKDKYPHSHLIILPLGDIYDGIYILRITIGNKDYRTQLIKQYR